jgi:4-amino-4-deoxy-L-arabinose transferase-like glycosyltransferase
MRHAEAALGLVVLLGLSLRAFWLGHQSLWTDEVLTSLSSTGSLSWVVTQKAINTNIPPLYYAVVHLFLSLGYGERELRLPSVLFGTVSILLLYAIARRLVGKKIALVSGALLAISPFHVWYSQEARPYALFLFLSLLSLLLLQRLIEDPTNRRRQAGFVSSTAATFYCHTLALPFIAFLAVYGLLATPRAAWRRWVLPFAIIAVLLIPAVYRLIDFAPTASADANRTLGVAFVPYAFWAFASGYSIGPTLTELHLPSRMATALHFAPVILPIALLFAVLSILGAVVVWRRSREVFYTLALWLLFPLGFALAGTLVTRHPFNVRYIVLALPVFLIAVSAGALSLRSAALRALSLTAVAGVSVYSLRNYFFDARYYREDNRAAGAYLQANAAASDLVIADAPYTAVNLQYYARRPDVTIVGYPTSLPVVDAVGTGILRSAGTGRAVLTRDGSDLGRLIGGRNRYWIFLSRAYHGAPTDEVLRFCDRNYARAREFVTENDIMLILYQARHG